MVLHKAGTAWRPSTGGKGRKEANQGDDLLKVIQSVTNKLTLENFPRLVEKINGLKITTEEHLEGVVDIIHEKATLEPKHCQVYAKLVASLVGVSVVCVCFFLVSF